MKFELNKNLFKVTYEGKEGYVITESNTLSSMPNLRVCYSHRYKNLIQFGEVENSYFNECRELIASTFPIGDLPQFVIENKNSEDELEVVVKEYIGMNPNKDWDNNEDYYNPKNREYYSFKDGWNKHAEKYEFTKEDVKKAILLALDYGYAARASSLNTCELDRENFLQHCRDNLIIKSLQQPKEITEIDFEVELTVVKHIPYPKELEVKGQGWEKGYPVTDYTLKITKTIKYPNGLLIIKKCKI